MLVAVELTSSTSIVSSGFDPNFARFRGRLLESLDELLEHLRGRLLLFALFQLLLLLLGQRPLAHAPDGKRFELLLGDFLQTNFDYIHGPGDFGQSHLGKIVRHGVVDTR
jgi:hypothetical protein